MSEEVERAYHQGFYEGLKAIRLIEHKADQRLNFGQYSEKQILGVILKVAREYLAKFGSIKELPRTGHPSRFFPDDKPGCVNCRVNGCGTYCQYPPAPPTADLTTQAPQGEKSEGQLTKQDAEIAEKHAKEVKMTDTEKIVKNAEIVTEFGATALVFPDQPPAPSDACEHGVAFFNCDKCEATAHNPAPDALPQAVTACVHSVYERTCLGCNQRERDDLSAALATSESQRVAAEARAEQAEKALGDEIYREDCEAQRLRIAFGIESDGRPLEAQLLEKAAERDVLKAAALGKVARRPEGRVK